MTLVSIITPSYNQSTYLEQTMLSVLEQDYPHVEYLVVDGGSNDGSVEIIKKHADRLAFWVSEKDAGQADAINHGLAHARGEIVAWLNSDDYYLPGTIGAAVRTFNENPEAVMVYGNMFAVDEQGQGINRLNYRQLTLEDLLCFQIIGQPAVFMRRSALERSGGLAPEFHCLLDHHLWIRLMQQGGMVHVPETWAAARYHPAAKNRARAVEFGMEAFRILEWAEHEPSLAPSMARVARRARASAHRLNARYLLDGNLPSAALAAWMRALLIHPPTALARLNLLVSGVLNLIGLGMLRERILQRRRETLR
jgi:GT2 family glycosyltransferase